MPVVASKVVGLVPNTVAEMTGINQTNTWKSIQERIAERKTNSRVQEALKELINKECKLIQNPQGINNGYDELYACKGGLIRLISTILVLKNLSRMIQILIFLRK
ncbi:hypothetical protein [Mycoplasma wenyonii]|uniref:hypothetical protein n=1 Tax=Mycoplasma wenyonii TaxID=65123 RepID=UPI0015EBFA4E|nr:hypothetical protein [Mycoplasma wenyonii]